MGFADTLKKISNSVHEGKHEKDVTDLYDYLIKKSKEAAAKGGYSVEVYDDRLINSEIGSALKLKLREDGFKVTIAEDHHYTEHSGTTQMYVRINWD